MKLPILLLITYLSSSLSAPLYQTYFDHTPKSLLIKNQNHSFRKSNKQLPWDYSQSGTDWQQSTCHSQSSQQSPINLTPSSFPSLSTETLTFLSLSSTVKVMLKYQENQLQSEFNWFSVKIGEKEYEAERVVFHFPSEHQKDGKEFDLEMQFQLRSKTQDNAFIVLFGEIEPNHRNSLLEPFSSAALNLLENKQILELNFKESFEHELLKLQPLQYISYQGSNNIPPCEPQFKWIIITEPMKISEEIVQQFNKGLSANNKKNNRKIQDKLQSCDLIKGQILGIQTEVIEQSEEVKQVENEEEKEQMKEQEQEVQGKGDNILEIQEQLEEKNKEVGLLVNKLKKIRQNELGVQEEQQQQQEEN